MSNDVKLPLTDVVPSPENHNVAYDVIDEGIKQGEARLAELTAALEKAQKQLNDTKAFADNLQLNRVVVNAKIEAFKELKEKTQKLEAAVVKI